MQDISNAQAEELIRSFFEGLTDSYTPPASWISESAGKQLSDQVFAAENFTLDFGERIAKNAQSSADLKSVQAHLSKSDIRFSQLPFERQMQIWRGVHAAYIEHVRFLERQLSHPGEHYTSENPLFQGQPDVQLIAGQTSTALQTKNQTSISEIVEIYIEKGTTFGTQNKPWGQTTISVNRRILGWFCEFTGTESPINNVDVKVCREFRDKLLTVKTSMADSTPFCDAFTPDKNARISLQTAKNQFDYLPRFFKWCVNEGYLNSNPASGLKVAAPKKPDSELPRPFTQEEVNLFFSSPMYSGYKSAKRRYVPGTVSPIRDAYFWTPLLQFYTGMRLAEIVNIPISNVLTDHAFPHFDLNSQYQQLKTNASIRKVPIHDDLREFGFFDWVETLKTKGPGSKPLMRGLKTKTTRQNYFSKILGNYIDRCVSKDPRLKGHSFRHYAIDRARDALIVDHVRNAIFGHSGPTSVADSYGSGTGLPILSTEMNKIEFGLSDETREILRNHSGKAT